MGVLRILNVAPTQLHPNLWTSLRAFKIICDIFKIIPTPQLFLFYYNSGPKKAQQALKGELAAIEAEKAELAKGKVEAKEREEALSVEVEMCHTFMLREVKTTFTKSFDNQLCIMEYLSKTLNMT
ncbi:hypothetical protein ACSQ67_009004 [Phaseolus vulgaris]